MHTSGQQGEGDLSYVVFHGTTGKGSLKHMRPCFWGERRVQTSRIVATLGSAHLNSKVQHSNHQNKNATAPTLSPVYTCMHTVEGPHQGCLASQQWRSTEPNEKQK